MAALTPSMTSRIQAFSEQGPRNTFEDRYFIDEKEGVYAIWGICDGHKDKGEIAELACDLIPKFFSKTTETQRENMP